MGMQGLLAERRDRLTGIFNGVDYRVWNPATDPHLAANYDVDSVTGGKPLCKAALQHRARPSQAVQLLTRPEQRGRRARPADSPTASAIRLYPFRG